MSSIREQINEVRTIISCANCEKEIPPVSEVSARRRWDDYPQPKEGVNIDLLGGYGMLFDDVDIHLTFCKPCFEILITAFPSLNPNRYEDQVP